VHFVVEVQLALLNELQQARGHERLGEGADAKAGVGRHGPPGLQVSQPQSALKQHGVVANEREHHSRNVPARHHSPQRILQLRQRAHGRDTRLGAGRGGEAQ
jgi:hypothetical protein